jgi:hypothetical protein
VRLQTREKSSRKHAPNFRDLAGRVFGQLRVSRQAGRTKQRTVLWHYRCKCGQRVVVRSNHLRSGQTKSCGCLRLEALRQSKITHGQAAGNQSPEYRAYCNAKTRCTNPRCHNFNNYGGRGIEFRFASFEDFLAAVGKRPSPRHSLDRYPDNDGHYEAGNVRWATASEQRQNQRRTAVRQ